MSPPLANRRFWADPGPDPGGDIFGIFILALSVPRLVLPCNQSDPEVIFGPSVFWRPGVPRQNSHTFSSNKWFLGLAAFGGKAKQL